MTRRITLSKPRATVSTTGKTGTVKSRKRKKKTLSSTDVRCRKFQFTKVLIRGSTPINPFIIPMHFPSTDAKSVQAHSSRK